MESRGGFNRGLLIQLEFREVRELADVRDERIRQEARECLDELGREWRPRASTGGDEPLVVNESVGVMVSSLGAGILSAPGSAFTGADTSYGRIPGSHLRSSRGGRWCSIMFGMHASA